MSVTTAGSRIVIDPCTTLSTVACCVISIDSRMVPVTRTDREYVECPSATPAAATSEVESRDLEIPVKFCSALASTDNEAAGTSAVAPPRPVDTEVQAFDVPPEP